MRFFKKRDKNTQGDQAGLDEGVRNGPRVEGDIVYDEDGNVLFDPTIGSVAAVSEEDTFSGLSEDYDDPALFAAEDETEPVADDEEVFETEDSSEFVEDEETVFTSQDYADTDDVEAGLQVELPDAHPTINVTREPAREPANKMAEPDLLHKRVNLGELRMDVARISSDIQSGERLYQRAQQRVESLMGFVERAEVDFSLLNRLEPENRRLKARNRVLEAESEGNAHQIKNLQQDLSDAQEIAAEAQSNYEATRARLSATESQCTDRDRQITTLTEDLETLGLRIERSQTSVEVESRENVVLREQISELSNRADDLMSERMELAKMVESLRIDCDDFRAQKDHAAREVSDLRSTLSRAQKVNTEMKNQMLSLHQEIKGFKTQYEYNVISREDRIASLENRIADLTKQLTIKEDVTKSALMDVNRLRKSRSTQELEIERLERLTEAQQTQLDESRSELDRSNASMAELDQRYNDVAAALSVHQQRLTPDGPAAPLTPPPPFKQRREGEPVDDSLTPENVEDMIMDYKLGLRSSIG